MPGSPAEQGGLEAGDIVLEYNGEAIELSSDLPPMVGRTPVGESARLTVLRGGDETRLDVVIGKLPEEGDDLAQSSTGSSESSTGAPLGLLVEPLTPEAARSVGVEGGVLVARVDRGPAFEAGIRPRDIITEIDRKQIRSVADFRSVVRDLPENRAVSVRIVRQGRAIYLVMKP